MYDCCGHCGFECKAEDFGHTIECGICSSERIPMMREFAAIIRSNYYPAELSALHAHDLLLQGVYLVNVDRPR